MTFEGMFLELEALGVEVEWIDPVVRDEFTAIINCETVTVKDTINGEGTPVITIASSKSQYPVEYIDVDAAYMVLSTQHVLYSGTKFTNVNPMKDGAVSIPFSDIKIGSYFYHGGVCLKVSDGSYFNGRIISIKLDTLVNLCIADVQHQPFVII